MAKRTIHVIAQCQDCPWRSEDYVGGEGKAQNHYVNTGHVVNIEVAHAYTLGRRAKAKLKS